MTERGKLFFDLVVAIANQHAHEKPVVIVEAALEIANAAYNEAAKQGFVHPLPPPPPRPAPAPVTQSRRGA